MQTRNKGRLQTWAAAITVGLTAGAIAACSGNSNPLKPTSAVALGASTIGQGDPALGPQLAAVRAATAAFHNIDRALATGYVLNPGEPCVASPAGTMGIHVINPALMASQSLDPEQPEILVYLPTSNGRLKLVAVEYLQFVLLLNPATGQIAPWTLPTPWPATYQVVTPTPRLFDQTFQGPMPGHAPGMPWHWDLHAWVWAHNPSGMFAQWNPSISCGA